MCRPGCRVGAWVIGHDKRIEFAHQRHRRPQLPPFEPGLHAGQRQFPLVLQSKIGKTFADAMGRLLLLKAQFGLVHDGFAQPDDPLALPINGRADSRL